MRTVLFLCTGNTCRSPMAEAIAREWLSRGHLDTAGRVFVASAGTAAAAGTAATIETIRTLRSLGLEHEGRAKPLTAEMIRRADLVLCMTAGQVEAARALVAGESEQEAKVLPLDASGDLEDPIGLGQHAYDALAKRLMELIPRRLKETLVA